MAGGAAIPIPYSPHSITATAPPHQWSGHGSALRFHRTRSGGDTTLITQITGTAAPVLDSLRHAVVARFDQSPRFRGVARLEDIPTAHPQFTGLSLDERGRLWVHRPASDATVSHFEVIDSTGVWLGTVRAPAGPSRGAVFANQRWYRITEDSAGLPVVEVYRIVNR
jgi:hypothetical protein